MKKITFSAPDNSCVGNKQYSIASSLADEDETRVSGYNMIVLCYVVSNLLFAFSEQAFHYFRGEGSGAGINFRKLTFMLFRNIDGWV